MMNRSVKPKGPPQLYKTYAVLAPRDTHWVQITCEEAECEHYLKGWMVILEDVFDADGQFAHAIHNSGRTYQHLREPGKSIYIFPGGQPCLKSGTHKKRIDRPELYIVQGGDYRGDPRREGVREYDRPDQWVDDFATHQENIITAFERG